MAVSERRSITLPESTASRAEALRRSLPLVHRRSSEHRAAQRYRRGPQRRFMSELQPLFCRTQRRTGDTAVESRRLHGGADWLLSGVTEGHRRSEQNKDDYQQARNFHLLSPCRSGGYGLSLLRFSGTLFSICNCLISPASFASSHHLNQRLPGRKHFADLYRWHAGAL
jgi:hypothetical protein